MIYASEIREEILRNRPSSITVTFYEPADMPMLKKPQQTVTFKRIAFDGDDIILYKNKNDKSYNRTELRFLSIYGNGIKSYKFDKSKASGIPFISLGQMYQDMKNNPNTALKITTKEPISFTGKDDDLYGKTAHTLNFIDFYKDKCYVSTGTTDKNALELGWIAEYYGILSYSFAKKKVTEAQSKFNEVLAQCQTEQLKKEITRYKTKISRNYYKKIELKDYLSLEDIKIIDDFYDGKYDELPEIETRNFTKTFEYKNGTDVVDFTVFLFNYGTAPIYMSVIKKVKGSYREYKYTYLVINSKVAYEY